jgi:hypothetical protein
MVTSVPPLTTKSALSMGRNPYVLLSRDRAAARRERGHL